MAYGIKGSFEADSLQGHTMKVAAALHDTANQVVGVAMEENLALDQFRALAPQYIRRKRHFDLLEVQLDVPSSV